MNFRKLTNKLSVASQIEMSDLSDIRSAGFKAVICNRPDCEEVGQVEAAQLAQKAAELDLEFVYMPVTAMSDEQGQEFVQILEKMPQPALAFCRTGTRSATLWAKGNAPTLGRDAVLKATSQAGYDLSKLDLPSSNSKNSAIMAAKAASESVKSEPLGTEHHSVVIIGGGAAGIAVAASLKSRQAELDICIVDPADKHYYQPGWTMVGGGIFQAESTKRAEKDLIPDDVKWIKKSAESFDPSENTVKLDDGSALTYGRMIVCPGLQLNWGQIKGLEETLGKNGVTSNYRYDLAPYTWELVKGLKSGKAIFTQPPMPIKCAGAPQKALYLSCSEWTDNGAIGNIQVDFCNAGGVLFGVADYVPALMEYVKKYNANLDFFYNLVEIDGEKKLATFEVKAPDTEAKKVKMEFDMIHVCPPQSAPDFIKSSPLSDDAGWVDVDPHTLRHKKFDNIWSLGDVMNAPNAKTAAAARKQAPVVADNIVADIQNSSPKSSYDGYGSCPLTVEKGKIVLAEFGYGGVLKPSFPKWALDGTKPTRRAWYLKERILPPIYWNAMLRGREWLAGSDKMKDEAQ